MDKLIRLQALQISLEVVCAFRSSFYSLPSRQRYLHGCDDFFGDFVLNGKYVAEIPVIAFRPQVTAVKGINQLGADSYLISSLSYAPLQNIPNPQFLADLLDLYGFALVGEGGVSSDHKELGNPAECRNDLLGEPVAEILLPEGLRSGY